MTVMFKAIHSTLKIQKVKVLEVAQYYIKLLKNEKECSIPKWCGSLSYHKTFTEAKNTLKEIMQFKIDQAKESLSILEKNMEKINQIKEADPIEKVDRNFHCRVCNCHSVISIEELKKINKQNIESHGDEAETYADTMNTIPYCQNCA